MGSMNRDDFPLTTTVVRGPGQLGEKTACVDRWWSEQADGGPVVRSEDGGVEVVLPQSGEGPIVVGDGVLFVLRTATVVTLRSRAKRA